MQIYSGLAILGKERVPRQYSLVAVAYVDDLRAKTLFSAVTSRLDARSLVIGYHAEKFLSRVRGSVIEKLADLDVFKLGLTTSSDDMEVSLDDVWGTRVNEDLPKGEDAKYVLGENVVVKIDQRGRGRRIYIEEGCFGGFDPVEDAWKFPGMRRRVSKKTFYPPEMELACSVNKDGWLEIGEDRYGDLTKLYEGIAKELGSNNRLSYERVREYISSPSSGVPRIRIGKKILYSLNGAWAVLRERVIKLNN